MLIPHSTLAGLWPAGSDRGSPGPAVGATHSLRWPWKSHCIRMAPMKRSSENPIEWFVQEVEALALTHGLSEMEWGVWKNGLRFRWASRAGFPAWLHLEPVAEGKRFYKSNGICGAYYQPDPGAGSSGSILDMALFSTLVNQVLPRCTASVMEAAAGARSPMEQVRGADLATLVEKGWKPGAIITIQDNDAALRQITSRLEFVRSDRSGGREDDRFHVAAQGTQPATTRLLFCSRDSTTAQRIEELFGETSRLDSTLVAPVHRALAQLLGYPDCCGATYPHGDEEHPGENELVRWVRVYMARGGQSLRSYPPWSNFVAARLWRLVFFEHFPCTPDCAQTRRLNERLLSGLFDAQGAALVRELLSTSFLVWPGGQILPFRVLRFSPGVVHVAQMGVLRHPELVPTNHRSTVLEGLPGWSREETAVVEKLSSRDGRVLVEHSGVWSQLSSPPPMLLAFDPGAWDNEPVDGRGE